MILEIKINNYRLFKGESTLSFLADARTKKLLSNSVFLDNRNVLKSLAVYGSNNAGKTNLFKLFTIIKQILLGKEDLEINRDLFGDQPMTTISIIYNNNDGKGWLKYEVNYDSKVKKYIFEKLSQITFYVGGNSFSKVLFEKDNKTHKLYICDESFDDALDYISSTKTILNSINIESEKFNALIDWKKSLEQLAESIEVVKMFNIPISKTIEDLKSTDEKKKRFINSFVKDADVSISNFDYSTDIQIIDDNQEIDEKALSRFERELDILHLSTTYGENTVPSLIFDSTGTKKMEAFASYLYDAIINGKTLVVDELDNGLHYRLTRAIISCFNNSINTQGQLFFTAHDLMLINCKMLLRKDQIYFIERNVDRAVLKCLKDLTIADGGPREGSDILKKYNEGELTPLPNPSFINELIALRGGEKR